MAASDWLAEAQVYCVTGCLQPSSNSPAGALGGPAAGLPTGQQTKAGLFLWERAGSDCSREETKVSSRKLSWTSRLTF